MPVKLALIAALAVAFLFYPGLAHAYIGPGLGLGLVGFLIAFLLTLVSSLIAVIWYPLKTFWQKITAKRRPSPLDDAGQDRTDGQ